MKKRQKRKAGQFFAAVIAVTLTFAMLPSLAFALSDDEADTGNAGVKYVLDLDGKEDVREFTYEKITGKTMETDDDGYVSLTQDGKNFKIRLTGYTEPEGTDLGEYCAGAENAAAEQVLLIDGDNVEDVTAESKVNITPGSLKIEQNKSARMSLSFCGEFKTVPYDGKIHRTSGLYLRMITVTFSDGHRIKISKELQNGKYYRVVTKGTEILSKTLATAQDNYYLDAGQEKVSYTTPAEYDDKYNVEGLDVMLGKDKQTGRIYLGSYTFGDISKLAGSPISDIKKEQHTSELFKSVYVSAYTAPILAISPKNVTIQVNDRTKQEGDADPAGIYPKDTVTIADQYVSQKGRDYIFKNDDGFVEEDNLKVVVIRSNSEVNEKGKYENVLHAVVQNTAGTPDVSERNPINYENSAIGCNFQYTQNYEFLPLRMENNYNIRYEDGSFDITERIVTPEPVIPDSVIPDIDAETPDVETPDAETPDYAENASDGDELLDGSPNVNAEKPENRENSAEDNSENRHSEETDASESKNADGPVTGDSSDIGVYLLLLAGSGIACIALARRRE